MAVVPRCGRGAGRAARFAHRGGRARGNALVGELPLTDHLWLRERGEDPWSTGFDGTVSSGKRVSGFAMWWPGIPRQKGNSPRIGRRRGGTRRPFILPDEQAEKETKRLLRFVGPGHRTGAPGTVPMDGPIAVTLELTYPIPKSWGQDKRKSALADEIVPGTRATPDTGNVLKLVEDVLQKAGWIRDDCLAVRHYMSAHYGEHPGYFIALYHLGDKRLPE